MTLLAQSWMIRTRNRVRGFGLARAVYSRWMASFDYEERFGKALLGSIDGQSTVWDVGANIGLYSEKFLAKGARRVVCVEPAPAAVDALRTKFSEQFQSRVVVVPVALSDSGGTALMAADGASPTNRLKAGNGEPGLIEVPVVRAEDLIRKENIPPPHVLKIDVEGYELEALRGFGESLGSAELRSIFIEIHFALLHARGLDHAPEEINSMLIRFGFKVRWLDLSHICGIRA